MFSHFFNLALRRFPLTLLKLIARNLVYAGLRTHAISAKRVINTRFAQRSKINQAKLRQEWLK